MAIIRLKRFVKSIGVKLRGSKVKAETLPKKTLWLWQIRVVMLTVLLIGACFYFISFLKILKIIVLVIALLGFVTVIWYLPVLFKSYIILFGRDAIIINHGVFIKFSHIMPYTRLIYAQSFATPIARLFGVTALSFKAARSRIILPEINLLDAEKIISSLTREAQYD